MPRVYDSAHYDSEETLPLSGTFFGSVIKLGLNFAKDKQGNSSLIFSVLLSVLFPFPFNLSFVFSFRLKGNPC